VTGGYMINLVELLSLVKDSIIIDDTYQLSCEYYKDTDVKNLSDIKVKGLLQRKEDENIYLDADVSGSMCIEDSITLEEVWYPFSFKIEENISEFIEKNENSLDLLELLWQNIVLEVPLRYTTVKDYSSYQGDGWKLVSEEELSKNNPFSVLLDKKDGSD